MDGSRTIRVIKRDGCEEPFHPAKLASAMHRAMQHGEGNFYDASQLAAAIEFFLKRTGVQRIASATIMDMALKVLRSVGMASVGTAMRSYGAWREWRRRQVRIRHKGGEVTLFDKSWLSELACRSWHVSPRAGRIIAAQVERDLLSADRNELRRDELQGVVNRYVAEFGLADAVPVEPEGLPA